MREMPMKFVFDEMVQPYVTDQHCSITGSNATNVIYEGLYLSLLNCGWNSNRQMENSSIKFYTERICPCIFSAQFSHVLQTTSSHHSIHWVSFLSHQHSTNHIVFIAVAQQMGETAAKWREQHSSVSTITRRHQDNFQLGLLTTEVDIFF